MNKDENGKVYIQYYQPIPKYIQIDNREYVCDVRYGVSMLLVDESEVQSLLDYLGGCCGGKRKVFALPSENAISVWKNGRYP